MTPPVATQGMVAQLARFAGALRDNGIRVAMGDEIDAARALTLIDLLDRPEVHRGLRIALKVPREAWSTFDALFDEYWRGGRVARGHTPRERTSRHRTRRPGWRWDGQRVQLVALEEDDSPEGDMPSYSPEAVLRHKSFEQLSAGELAAMERLLARLALKLATRRSRRLVPVRGRGMVDLRRSFRRALATEGDLLGLARRDHALEEPRIVLLFDTSGSMDAHTRVLLTFAFALRRAVKRVEIFVFNTALIRVTRVIAPHKISRALEQLAATVPDWSGGTRIGDCLAEFVAEHKGRLIARDTTVIVVSDGLDRGDTAALAGAMRDLRERAGSIVWLNPLMADARYRPETEGMRAALPFIDHFGPAHNLASLEGLLRVLA